jgi:LysM repeat protein
MDDGFSFAWCAVTHENIFQEDPMKQYRWLPLLSLFLLFFLVSAVQANTSYVVRPGDTLFKISRQYGVSIQALAEANHIVNPNLIYVGQVLVIPTGGGTVPPPPAPPPPGTGSTYVVQRGDTLSRIAARFGVTVTALAQANNIANPNVIYVGQVLTIPGGGGSVTPPPPPPPPPPSGGSSFELGGQVVSLGNQERMKYAGMHWVKFQHKWSPGDDPGSVAGRIQEAHAAGFKVLLSVTGANVYPAANSIDFGSFVNFMRGVASLGANAPEAIEVWNEMNIDFEWPAGQISPAAYVNNMLAPTYNAIKAANPNIMVISGAPAPTGFDNGHNAWADNRYMAGMAAAGAAQYLDCVGVHHNAGATAPAAATGHPGGAHYSWYYGPTANVYYNAFGGARRLCFTEIGYLSGEGFGGLPANFAWAANTTVARQAQWLAEAVNLARSSGRVRLFIIFNVDFTYYNATGDPQAGYAIIRPDGTCPACDTLRAVTGGR